MLVKLSSVYMDVINIIINDSFFRQTAKCTQETCVCINKLKNNAGKNKTRLHN